MRRTHITYLFTFILLLLLFSNQSQGQSLKGFFKRIKGENVKEKEKEDDTPVRNFDFGQWLKERPRPENISFSYYSGSTLENIWGTLENDYIPIIYLDAPKTESSDSGQSATNIGSSQLAQNKTETKQTKNLSLSEYFKQLALSEEEEEQTEMQGIMEGTEIIDIVDDGVYSPIPSQYKIWSTDSIDPYGVDMSESPDTLKINVSSYQSPGYKYVTSDFGWRRSRMHYGIDLKVYTGDTIRSAFDNGVVRIKRFNRKGYGNYVVIRHDNGLETLYGHMSKTLVNEGDTLKVGDVVGLGGSTGRSSGSHLHFEIRYLGKAINPKTVVDFENNKLIKNTLVLTKNNFIYGRGKSKSTAKGGSKGSSKSSPSTITVRRGDTLGAIARRYGTTVTNLKKLNGLKSNNITAGKKLRVR